MKKLFQLLKSPKTPNQKLVLGIETMSGFDEMEKNEILSICSIHSTGQVEFERDKIYECCIHIANNRKVYHLEEFENFYAIANKDQLKGLLESDLPYNEDAQFRGWMELEQKFIIFRDRKMAEDFDRFLRI